MKAKLQDNFSLIILILTAALFAVGMFYLEKRIVVSLVVASLLLFISISYYLIYFTKYKNIIDNKVKNNYILKLFSFTNVFWFAALFVAVFSFIGAAIDAISPELGFGGVGFLAIFSYLAQSVINGLSLGFISAFNLEFSAIVLKSYFAITLVYVATLLICIGFFAAVFARIKIMQEASNLVDELIHGEELNQEYFSDLNAGKLKNISKRIKTGEIDLDVYGDDLVVLLSSDQSKQTRTIHLTIMDVCENIDLYALCLDYFLTVKDKRFKHHCMNMKVSEKLELLRLRGLNDKVEGMQALEFELKSEQRDENNVKHGKLNDLELLETLEYDQPVESTELESGTINTESMEEELRLDSTGEEEITDKSKKRNKNKNRNRNKNRNKERNRNKNRNKNNDNSEQDSNDNLLVDYDSSS